MLAGMPLGTAAGLLSLPPAAEGGAGLLSSMLLWGAVPLIVVLAAGKRWSFAVPALSLFRGCALSWALTLLLRSGQYMSLAAVLIGSAFMLPAFLLCASLAAAERRGSRDWAAALLAVMLWFLSSVSRWLLYNAF